ncbi:hypothetical protein C0584_04075 [Candidatus Parcubacteria bacterium]|nr:MAG: hypothetical protein C0584_04075 [Candidatus Parcubacteria bacterium]
MNKFPKHKCLKCQGTFTLRNPAKSIAKKCPNAFSYIEALRNLLPEDSRDLALDKVIPHIRRLNLKLDSEKPIKGFEALAQAMSELLHSGKFEDSYYHTSEYICEECVSILRNPDRDNKKILKGKKRTICKPLCPVCNSELINAEE